MPGQFWGNPPEVNDFTLRLGAGPAAHTPQVAAYTTVAGNYIAQTSQIMATTAATVPSWDGVGGAAMGAEAGAKAGWHSIVGSFATKAASTIGSMVAAYGAAIAASIPAAVSIANRVRQAALIASNIIGQNSIAIAEGEVEYMEQWGQNGTVMTGYETTAMPLVSALSVPLVPPDMGAGAAGMGAGAAAVAAQAASTGVQALGAGLSQGGAAAAQAAGSATSVASGVAGSAASQAQQAGNGGQQPGTAAGPAGAKSGAETDFLSQAQSMAGPAMSAPQALQGAAQPLTSAAQMGPQAASQFAGMGGSGMGGNFGGLSGGPGIGGLPTGGPGSVGMGAGNGGFAGGGSPVTAALTKPSGSGAMSGPAGLPGNWWSNNGMEGRALTGARAGGSTGAVGGAGAPGMYGMPAGASGSRSRQGARDVGEADQEVVFDGIGDGVPVFTDDGAVVYTTGTGV
ncbi:PPE domain-containing protein [Mycobacteroides abscessus]|uniref:PPE domain-containing protein n=1 Tax=Mycobacteroides abscessus TaxID=36809 RepID=UPI0009A713C5|nr:PPE domain-containing protein [Mycobacteroides abscessus]SLF48361.1 PPE-repeat containing protein [Mycobacteroides abscessus subsp. abscessus]